MKLKLLALFLIVLMQLIFIPVQKAQAVTPPDRGLGAADPYGVFGALGVTNTGVSTHIWGDVGANSSVTGLDDATQVDGTIKIAPATNGVATDASSTYDSLMSSLQGTSSGLDLAGTNTIVPGVYDVAASTLNGALTLDGAGIYIFRSSSSNTTAHSGTMNLINGACASNVFWAVSTSMTIGTGAHVEGTIIASTGSITLATGATLVGRAISLTQQVTLQSNQITQPTCATATATATAAASLSSSSTSDIAPCIASEITTVPIIIDSKRISPTSIFISWGPYAGINTFNVEYGLTSGSRPYNVSVTGFSTTINNLPANQPIWVQVAATNNCSIGTYGESKLAGAPSLPNTGFAPHKNNIPWYIPAGIFAVFSVLFILIQKKYNF